jgi:ferredoxin-NADP reductase
MTEARDVKIKEIIQRTYNVKSFRVAIDNTVDFKAGQFLSVWLKPEKGYQRYLSISSSPTEKGYLEFTKKITESEFSKTLDSLKAGDLVSIQYPFGKFGLDEPNAKIAFLSGGIGITPIRSICKYVVDSRLDTDIILVYANRNIKDIVFREDFELMQGQYPKLRVSHVLSEPATGFKCCLGHIDRQIIITEIPDYTQRKFYLCGPPGMVEAMKKILSEELSLPEENIITENFQGY